jgi:peptidoglycan/LPS O-acetylase OafA/YrhL
VLSGYVLSILFFKVKKTDVVRNMALKRYIRLSIPAAVSVFIAYVLISLHIPQNTQLALMVHNPSFFETLNFPAHLSTAIYQAFWGIYLSQIQSNVYNPVLWTMMYEFLGSMVVFGFLALVGKLKFRWVGYILLLMFTYSGWFLGFILGMVLADISANRVQVVAFFSKYRFLLPVLAISGLYMGGYTESNTVGPWYSWMSLHFIDPNTNYSFWLSIGAFLLTASINWSKLGRRILSVRPLVKLGSYTYSIYLTHIFILTCLLPVIFVGLRGLGVGYSMSALVSVALCLPVILAVGRLYARYVDVPAIRLSRAFANAVLQERYSDFKPTLPRQLNAPVLAYRTTWNGLTHRKSQKRKAQSEPANSPSPQSSAPADRY